MANLARSKESESLWQNNISDAIQAFQTEVGYFTSDPKDYIASGKQYFLAGQLQAMQQFSAAANLAPNLAFSQALNAAIKLVQQIIALPSGTLPSANLLSSLTNSVSALNINSPSLALTQSQFYLAMGSIINNISINIAAAVSKGENAFNQLIGQCILLFNISVFEGPADPNGYRPVSEPNLNDILDDIPAMDAAISSNAQDWIQDVLQNLQGALVNLQIEYPF
jgi:hypothetical protein